MYFKEIKYVYFNLALTNKLLALAFLYLIIDLFIVFIFYIYLKENNNSDDFCTVKA